MFTSSFQNKTVFNKIHCHADLPVRHNCLSVLGFPFVHSQLAHLLTYCRQLSRPCQRTINPLKILIHSIHKLLKHIQDFTQNTAVFTVAILCQDKLKLQIHFPNLFQQFCHTNDLSRANWQLNS